MNALAAAAVWLFLTMQGHAQTAAINMEGLKIMPAPEDIRTVSPARLAGHAAAMSVRVVEHSNRSCWSGSVLAVRRK
jgi:hypothetical protein